MGKPLNIDPFQPWNNPMYENDPFAAHNNLMEEDNPFKPWNDPMGTEDDLTDEEAETYGIRRRKYPEEGDNNYE